MTQPTEFDIYCDECFPDLLTSSKPQAQYVIIGSLWLPTSQRSELKAKLHALRDAHKVGGEIKSRKVSPSRLEFYKELVDLFIDTGLDLRFRAIVIDRLKVDLSRFHGDSAELSFYKFYYQMLHHWIGAANAYHIFCDYQTNQHPARLTELQQVLSNANPLSEFKTVQWVRSKESVLTQFADVLTGLTSAKLNKTIQAGSAKKQLLHYLEAKRGRPIQATGLGEQKFNLFQIALDGGW
jgi:hypothetical protein